MTSHARGALESTASQPNGALGSAAYVLALTALFLFTALFRFLQLKDGFPNDHFLYIAGGQQILNGDWPTRDFLDQGLPLMFFASALAQRILGAPLFAEAALMCGAYALAAVLTAAAVRELTGSRVLALLAAAVEVAIVTRTYGYPKVLVYAAGFFLLQRYVIRPTLGRLFALSAAIVVAFLFRHDHGIYLGIGGVLATWLADIPGRGRGGVRRAATLGGLCVLLTTPYLVYVQVFGGIWPYLQTGLEFRAGEIARQPHVWPSLFGDRPHHAALVYEYWAIPLTAALILFMSRRRAHANTIIARVAPLIVVALLVNWTFIRDPLITRLQDAIAPAVTLGPWLVAIAWRSRHPLIWRPIAALLVVVVARSVMGVGPTIEQLDRAGLLVTWRRIPEFAAEVSTALHERHAERQLPSRAAHALMPFYTYVDRCTTRDHRLLVGGFAPEVPVFTQRAFAGGQLGFVQGYYGGETYQRLVLQRLHRQVVPFVVLPGAAAINQFDTAFPLLAHYVRIRYAPLVTLGDDASTAVQVLFDSELPVAARDPETGWPCEVANEWTVFAKGKRR
jgi:hypothetical protein